MQVYNSILQRWRSPFCAFNKAFWSFSSCMCCTDSSSCRWVSELFDNRSDSSARMAFNCMSYSVTADQL